MNSPLLKPCDNCWRVEHADRVAFLVDGACYFHVFREAAKNARRSLLILGWDFDSRFQLVREGPDDGFPTAIGEFLENLVERSRQLRIHVLDWDYSMIYAPGREWLPWYKMDWATGRRLRFHLDGRHPFGASHHQKIVVIDDRLAFVGGLDFALGRWDTPAHRAGDPRRRDLDRTIPQPYHDVQAMVGGPAARALGELVRRRWYAATGDELREPDLSREHDPWPDGVAADLADVDVGIARTFPEYGNQREVREVERLLLDAIAAARGSIYIEQQFFTSGKLGDALAGRLGESGGPEVVLVLPRETVGWLSRATMDVLGARLVKRLRAADRHGRLRVYYPDVPGLDDQCINMHAKVLIIDDRLLCVGSANFNNRSMGLDTECDLAIESGDEARIREALVALRSRLLGEHLDVEPSMVSETLAQTGSLVQAVERLNGPGRRLVTFDDRVPEELDALVPEAGIADPEMPIGLRQWAPLVAMDDGDAPAWRSPGMLLGVLGLALALAAAWHWMPLGEWIDLKRAISRLGDLRGEWAAPFIVIAIYIVASLLVLPVTLLIIATGAAFGTWYGFAYAVLGAEVSALFTYAVGQAVGKNAVHRLPSRLLSRIDRRLARRGLAAVVAVRLVPVAPFTVINLVAGASRIRLRDFAAGTVVGMAPMILALTVFSGQLVATIREPAPGRVAGLLALAAAIGIGAWAFGRWLWTRQEGGGETDTRQAGQKEP